jgi:hypothetical protein
MAQVVERLTLSSSPRTAEEGGEGRGGEDEEQEEQE